MGNSGSSFHQQQCASNGPSSQETARGWTHSFPRELAKQPPGLKVLPEPPNQRLRATNNGSIIHNGGTISGRRPSTLTLPHDLNKQGDFRGRSTSASNLGGSRIRNDKHQSCCSLLCSQQSNGVDLRKHEIIEVKKFGSEPDLRYSPLQNGHAKHHENFPEKESKDRENRYRNRKKYKAPPPPANGMDGSSPDSCNWEVNGKLPNGLHAPPRRSRLFKTRAETKKSQMNWSSSSSNTRDERQRPEMKEVNGVGGGRLWREQMDDCWLARKRHKIFDGKNTLQRSMSSPEFQAELMQAARKVRTKLEYHGRGESKPNGFMAVDRIRGTDPGKISRSKQEEPKAKVSGERKLDNNKVLARSLEKERVEYRNSKNQENHGSEKMDGFEGEHRRTTSAREKFDEVSRVRKPLHERADAYCYPADEKKRKDVAEAAKTSDKSRSRVEEPRENVKGIKADVSASRKPREKLEVRGQGSGRESTPEPSRNKDKENSDPRRRKPEGSRDYLAKEGEKRRQDCGEKSERNEGREKVARKSERENHSKNTSSTPTTSTPKTFYFGMDEPSAKETRDQVNKMQSRLHGGCVSNGHSDNSTPMDLDEERNQNAIEDIALKLRPTLPKKQLEIPRFSPSAAWRLLSASETPGPTMSTASEEVPVLFEERIERLSRPPPPLIAMAPRSAHEKSGDSGISGDAGAGNDDSLDVGMPRRMKLPANRPAWTPQQDLGEDSSSDAGVDSPPPPPIASPVKFPTRAHVFSLSLPREDNRLYSFHSEPKKDASSFNSLQKLRRSVTGAFGLMPLDFEKKRVPDPLDDNWLLSSSAPTSLQHCGQLNQANGTSSLDWEDEDAADAEDENEERFPIIMKTPSFSYLASGGHVMYLPESSGTHFQSSNTGTFVNSNAGSGKTSNSKYRKNNADEIKRSSKFYSSDNERSSKYTRNARGFLCGDKVSNQDVGIRPRGYSKSCENIAYEMRQRNGSPGRENLRNGGKKDGTTTEPKGSNGAHNSKSKKFTFQSTVRQIERRRLAEKLSREAEVKEKQRKNELEAMRKVEEEFQKKRAREKANIRQQLRLYSMDENLSSLPTIWDSSQISRAEPDGAPSSSASSPTSAPQGKLSRARKNSACSDEQVRFDRKSNLTADSRNHQHREYKDYRSRYYDWTPDNSAHAEYKHTTVHPKVVYDIPKSSPVFVDANVHATSKPVNLNSTPRSDNYRKDFAHGAVAAKSSLASSDSEISQPNTRPHSRQTGSKSKALRSRSASPARSEGASSGNETPVEPVRKERNLINNFALNGVQPFVREKNYRPIAFNPQPSPPIPTIPS